MKNLTIETITAACRGTLHGSADPAGREAAHVVIDSRKAGPGDVFVAINGERVDGHTFIPSVMEKGALCAVSEQDLGERDFPWIRVESTAQALLDIAKLYRDSFDIKVVGISGSVGKTSTKEMIASVLAQKYSVHKTQGNLNSDSGLPLTVFELQEENEVSVLEMGINHFGEMRKLSTVAQPDVCVITNIGVAHLEFLKTQQGILQEKTQMFQDMKPGGSIILNGDDPLLSAVGPVRGVKPLFYGTNPRCDIYADEIRSLGLQGSACVIHTPDGSFACTVPTPGAHMISNALAGAAVGYVLGLTGQEIRDGIEHLPFLPGRNNIIKTGRNIILDDCYNANPVSTNAALDVLALSEGRKVAVLGDMGELGENELDLHYQVGAYAAGKGIDLVCGIGPMSESLIRGVNDAGTSTKGLWFATKEDFLAAMDDLIKNGDNVLVKASKYMKLPVVIEALKER